MKARGHRILLLCLMSVVAAIATATVPAEEPFQFGASVHVGQGRNPVQETIAALTGAGLTFRDEVLWNRVETKRDLLNYPASLEPLEQLVNDAVARHKPPLLILDYGNAAYDGGGMIASREGIEAFSRYAAFVVQHFNGRVKYFEVWNEWNIGMGTHPLQKRSAESYVNLLKSAYAAIKRANPDAVVIGGVMNGFDLDWVDAFGRADGFSYLDAFSLHPYEFWYGAPVMPGGNSKTTARDLVRKAAEFTASFIPAANGETSFHPVPGTPESAFAKIDRVKAKVDQYAGGKGVPLYITEVGWPTNDSHFGVPESVAAAYLQRFFLLGRARPWVAGIWWYDLFDDGDDATNKEHRYGLRHHNGDSKSVYAAMTAIEEELSGPGPFTADIAADGTVSVSGTLANRKSVKIVWLGTNDFRQTRVSTTVSALMGQGFRAAGTRSGDTATAISAVPTIYVQR